MRAVLHPGDFHQPHLRLIESSHHSSGGGELDGQVLLVEDFARDEPPHRGVVRALQDVPTAREFRGAFVVGEGVAVHRAVHFADHDRRTHLAGQHDLDIGVTTVGPELLEEGCARVADVEHVADRVERVELLIGVGVALGVLGDVPDAGLDFQLLAFPPALGPGDGRGAGRNAGGHVRAGLGARDAAGVGDEQGEVRVFLHGLSFLEKPLVRVCRPPIGRCEDVGRVIVGRVVLTMPSAHGSGGGVWKLVLTSGESTVGPAAAIHFWIPRSCIL